MVKPNQGALLRVQRMSSVRFLTKNMIPADLSFDLSVQQTSRIIVNNVIEYIWKCRLNT